MAKHHIASRWLRKAAIIYLLITTQPLFADLLLFPLEHKNTSGSKLYKAQKVDVIFTPACYYSTFGDVSEIARWSECSLQRLVRSAQLAKKLNVPIIVTGGNFLNDDSVNYAEKASHLLESLGVPQELIIVEGNGTSTQEEVEYISASIANKRLLLVTSATHVERCIDLIQNKAKINNLVFAPVNFHSSGELSRFPSFPSTHAASNVQFALYEYGARVKKWLKN